MRISYLLLLGFVGFVISISCSTTESNPIYTISTSASPSEAGSVTQARSEASQGESIEITASSNDHWVFDRWSGDHSGRDNPASVVMDSNKDIVAFFIKREYPLNISFDGEGSVKESVIQRKSEDYEHDTTVELTAKAADGWSFSHWEGDLDGEVNPITIEIDGEKQVTAVFIRKDYSLTINIEGQGAVSEEVIQAKSTDYPFETLVELTANSATDWSFSHWEGDRSGEENPTSIAIDTDKDVTAVFIRDSYVINLSYEGEGSVSLELIEGKVYEDSSYQQGSIVELTANPSEDWLFKEWSGDLVGNENPQSITIDSDKHVEVVFERDTFTLSVEPEGHGSIEVELVNGAETPNGYTYQSQVRLTATADEDWEFSNWTGDLSGTQNPITLELVNDASVIAVFKRVSDQLFGFGGNMSGQLGDGTTTNRLSPIPITSDISSVSAGEYATLFVTSTGTLMGMGANATGELGYGEAGFFWRNPVLVQQNVKDVAINNWHSLFIKEDGTLYAMGSNDFGQLGDGTTFNRTRPVEIDTDVVQVSVGLRHSLYLKSDGTLWAMGDNDFGQLGDGTRSTRINPVNVALNVEQISAGYRHSMYITTTGTLYGMGFNIYGQLGTGSVAGVVSSPVYISGNVESVSAGKNHTLFVKNDNTAWAMGQNDSGQLGDGSLNQRNTPVQVETDIISISAGYDHSLFIKSNNTMLATGLNDNGQLGNGTTTNSNIPIEIATDVREISAGGSHSILIKN